MSSSRRVWAVTTARAASIRRFNAEVERLKSVLRLTLSNMLLLLQNSSLNRLRLYRQTVHGATSTNQRTDAVAMRVLDPQEVAEVEVWAFDFTGKSAAEQKQILGRAEYTIYKKAFDESKLKAVLNEKDIPVTKTIILPKSHRAKIVPEPTYSLRKHPDIRIARRAAQAAELAKIVTERKVSKGLRRTLYQQARRIESLSKQRLDEITAEIPVEKDGED